MQNFSQRTELLFGIENIKKLQKSKVIVFGIGGVGGYCAETLARCCIENIDLVDNDTIVKSNINRQIIATHDTIGRLKVDVMKERLMSINKEVNVECINTFLLKNEDNVIDFSKYDYLVDALDTITAKLTIIEEANKLNKKVISSMGTGNKINPTMLEVTDIYKTTVCPLARVMRTELKKRNIKKLKVVYSKETPIKPLGIIDDNKAIPASIAFVPSVAGLIIASEVVKDIISEE